ncbi:MAG: RtcB family protein [Armatimonadetes bacterium]|nr:RtcB family protein [Armatimonadota bacterium]
MAEKYTGKLEQLDAFRWRIPVNRNLGMTVPGIIYADQALMDDMRNDPALQQVANVGTLPGIMGASLAMPDFHYGYGFSIGGVAGIDAEEGVISPGGVGYDINCGVRLLRSDLTTDDIRSRVDNLIDAIYANVPAGTGKDGKVPVKRQELEDVLVNGAGWAVKRGFGRPEDLTVLEEEGAMDGADPDALTDRAIERGSPQLGTLGSGNHFLEIQEVVEVFDERVARVFGIEGPGQVTVMVHTGSRGLGHQTCDDSLEEMQDAVREYGLSLVDRQLACAPVGSPQGRRYFAAMACAANYAWANRQCITHWVRAAFEQVLGKSERALGLDIVYDVAHNIAKFETHEVKGRPTRLCVHRKGATRAFGPGRPEVPAAYRQVGQPVIVPGDMGRNSYLLVGTEEGMQQTWGSTCHGAGRRLSRTAALKLQHSQAVIAKLRRAGIYIRSAGKKTVAEEAPEAYKDVNDVVRVCDGAGISRLVAKMRPLGVMKG